MQDRAIPPGVLLAGAVMPWSIIRHLLKKALITPAETIDMLEGAILGLRKTEIKARYIDDACEYLTLILDDVRTYYAQPKQHDGKEST